MSEKIQKDGSNKSQSNVVEDKQTKKKSNAQKAVPIMIVVIVSLVIILMCTLIAYYQVYKSGKQNANILEGVYSSSYYSMVDNVNNLSVNVDKYATLSSRQSKLSTLHDMIEDCSYVVAGLSLLPIEETNVSSATKFFNQISGLCDAYSVKLNKGQELSQSEELMFDKIGLVLDKIKSNMNKQNMGMYDTGFNFVDASVFDNTGMNELSTGLGDLTSESIDYPAMIFDGPFSTALETKQVRGLSKEEVTKDQAIDYLKNTVYKDRKDVKIQFESETDGDIATYDFKVVVEDKDFFAQVSKRGGLLMTISGYAEQGDPIMKSEQAMEMAKTFSNNIGFENMEAVWEEIHENVAYINLAPVVNGVIYYPDLVKVKVDMTAQDIIGYEALNYALNHVDRDPQFDLNENEAENALGFDYQIMKTSKVVIRLDGGKEISCYEFVTERMDGMYFYYVDAKTGEIAKTMKLVTIKDVKKLV